MIVTAVSLFNEGDLSGAEAVLQRILSTDPDNDAACYYMGSIAIARNDAQKAEIYLKKAADADPGNFWYRYRLAGLYALTSRQELTIDMYEKLLKDFPKKSELYFDLVELYAANSQEDKALKTIDEIETIFGTTEPTAIFRFKLLQSMNKPEEAIKSLEEYNSRYSSPFVLTTLADYQMSMYNDSTALGYYDEALEISPDYAPALLGKAETLRLTRRYDEYFETLYDFVALPDAPVAGKSDYLLAVLNRLDPKFIRNFQTQFDTVVGKGLQVHPGDSTMLQLAGTYYVSTSRNDIARKCFLSNIRIHPESASSYEAYVGFLFYLGDWKEVSEVCHSAYGRFPEKVDFLEYAALGEYGLEDYDKALESFRRLIDKAPSDTAKTLKAWTITGDIHMTRKEFPKAVRAYKNALKVDPDAVVVLNNYAYCLSLSGKSLKKAYEMSLKTVEAHPDNATYLDTFGWILYLQGKYAEAKTYFKRAMMYGGKESAVVMDHYAEVLYALGEHDLAFVYWDMAKRKNNGEIPDLEEKIRERKNGKR